MNLDFGWNNSYFLNDASRPITSYNPIRRDVDNSILQLVGGTNVSGKGAWINLYGSESPSHAGSIYVGVPNAAKDGYVFAFTISGNTQTPIIDIQGRNISHLADPVASGDVSTKNYADTLNTTQVNNASLYYIPISELKGGSSSVAFGGTIAHGFSAVPTWCQISGTNASQTKDIVQLTSANIIVCMNGTKTGNKGVTETIYWTCRK